MAKEAKVDYDQENDILWARTDDRIKDSLEIDNFVIDFSAGNKIVGVEIYQASKMVQNLTGIRIRKGDLSKIKTAILTFHQSKELFYVVVMIALPSSKGGRPIPIQVPVPAMAVAAR